MRSHEITAHAPTQCKAYAILVEARFCSKDKNSEKFFTMQECSPSSTPTSAVRGKEKPSKEEQGTNEVRKSAGTSSSQKGGKKPPALKDNTSEGSSNITLNATALGSALAEALKSSFEGLRDSMNAGFTGLGDLIASHSVDEEPDDGNDDADLNGSNDDDKSLDDGELPAKKSRLVEPGNNRNPLISKLTKTLQFTKHVGPAINGDLASVVDKIMREKANEDKITDLKKQHETSENCTTLSETKVSQGVWNNLDESARSTDLKFQKVQKSLVKGILIIVTEVNKLMGNLGPQNVDDTVGSLMDGVLLLANANQELNYRWKELMRPQLNANYRHLCSPSNPITSLLFADDLPKAVKDISDTNRPSSKLTKDTSSTRSARSSQQCTHWQAKRKYDVHRNLGCVHCSFIPSVFIPCGSIFLEGTYTETPRAYSTSFGPKSLRSDRLFA